MTKHRQHYVWQNYLGAWCNPNGLVHYSRSKQEPCTTNPKNVMVERHFYRLQPLTEQDIDFLIWYVQDYGPPDLKHTHQTLIELFVLVTEVHKATNDNHSIPPSQKEKIENLLIESEENLHGRVENYTVPILKQLRQKQSDFIKSDELAAVFFFYLAQQYCRTKNHREPIGNYFAQNTRLQTSANISNILCYIMACNLGCNLASNSESLENTNPGFVAGDQPIINLLANRFGGDATDYAFYYPLSPHLACLLTHKSRNLSSKHIPTKITN